MQYIIRVYLVIEYQFTIIVNIPYGSIKVEFKAMISL